MYLQMLLQRSKLILITLVTTDKSSSHMIIAFYPSRQIDTGILQLWAGLCFSRPVGFYTPWLAKSLYSAVQVPLG